MDKKLLNGAVRYMAHEQRNNGGFYGYTSTKLGVFQAEETLPTNFFTALMLRALHDVPDTTSIQRKAAQFLLVNKNANWSWNYWEKNDPIRKITPYPDDLDDTACALLALGQYDSKIINGSVLAKFAQLLIANEVSVGGPYLTWLVPKDLRTQWGDTDIAVNANIGNLLAHHGVSVEGLENFVDNSLKSGALTSPYYVGKIPTLYFLAPWYRGKNLQLLESLVCNELKKPSHDALMLSMLICSYCMLGLPATLLPRLIKKLMSMRQSDHWPALALYVHNTSSSSTVYAGSAALTTALALQAIYSCQKIINQGLPSQSSASNEKFLKQALKYSEELPHSELRENYQKHIKRTVEHDKLGQIKDIATITAQAYQVSLSPTIQTHLNLASLHGWIAYTIYDDFIDEEGQPADLGVANLALRQTTLHFTQALPNDHAFQELVDSALNVVDVANSWEIANARAPRKNNQIIIKSLPKYKDYSKLAERSWGHILAASGVVISSGRTNTRAELQHLHKFFHHYLIARQLNDDAHDWEEDLHKGHLSAAVTLLLQDSSNGSVTLNSDMDALRLHFWEHTIVKIAKLVRKHTKLARQALATCAMLDASKYLSWVDMLDEAVSQALRERNETKKFIKVYET